jgi:amino acid adenylation domain-containing protein/thioester reductase-like protein
MDNMFVSSETATPLSNGTKDVDMETQCPGRLGSTPIPDKDYQVLVEDFNNRQDQSLLGRCLDQQFQDIVERFPTNVALVHNESRITYEELNASANTLARSLEKQGLSHGDVVGLAVSRSFGLVTAMLAVLKLGAAYVPIDPSFPAQRIDLMIEDADPKLILVSEEPTQGLVRWSGLCVNIGEIRDDTITDASNLRTQTHSRMLAYIIYTSGSTGRPKGVQISHDAAANFLGSLRTREPGCNEHDRLLAITTISFDMSALELFLPILSGATMVIANAGTVRHPREMMSLIETHQVTILQATPATWAMLLQSGWRGRISKIICGGEALSRQLADDLLACADSVWNVYGPAETTYGSVGRIDKSEIVVGKPVVNGRMYVLDDDLSPVPMGLEGELYIGGASVSNGYRNNDELTRSRFLDNPFHDGVFFRTGDLARFIAPGRLQVLGRIDGVVKIHGNRIDVGDIEAALVKHPDISAAVVIDLDDRLVAYCVLSTTASHDVSSLGHLMRPWISERLPLYMLPAFFVPMDALPLSPSEKVNRKALPDPLTATRIGSSSIQSTSELERIVKAVWTEVLGYDHFGVDDSFFHVGGDSVRIIRVQAALERRLCRSVPTPILFEHFTIRMLAAFLAGTDSSQRLKSIPTLGTQDTDEDIAVVSTACRLPGGIDTPELFWDLLQSGEDAITRVPQDRWDTEKLFDVAPKGGFLDSIGSYDASFFGISPIEAQEMDPEQHLMLELCWESFERAGYSNGQINGSATGVFFGVSRSGAMNGQHKPELKGYSITGTADATLSGRVSYVLDLRGPSMAVDTACSSSLVATHLACNALRRGECNMAIAGGVSLLQSPVIHIEFSKLGGLAADGRCKTFSDDTDGTVFSEGAVTMMLKRLSDARRDGDRIHGVIRGTAVSHGGRSAGLTVPNGPGQESLIRTALSQASLDPNGIDYVEAHGTATKLGDPIEATALVNIFTDGRTHSNPLRLGSAKCNVGHTQAAAGLVGLLKVLLSMENNTMPKSIHVSEPTRAIDWKSKHLELVLENQPWLPNDGRIRRAGVSAFGIGGTNAHVIAEEYREQAVEMPVDAARPANTSAIRFLLSGSSDSALRAQAAKLRVHLESGQGRDQSLADVAYSLATSRTHFRHRMAIATRDKPQVLEQLRSISSGASELSDQSETGRASLAMLFTGQSSKRVALGKDLYAVFPAFRNALDKIAAHFMELGFSLLDTMWVQPENLDFSLLDRTDFAQPALFAFEVSLWRLWQSWGVTPAFLLGHSLGELVVAHASGILSLPDACRLVLERGRLMQAVTRQGKMTVVETGGAEIEAVIRSLNLSEKVRVAAYNTPFQTVLSGDIAAVEAVENHFKYLGIKQKTLKASRAFHSHHMDEMLSAYEDVAKSVKFDPPRIPVISSMTGKLAVKGELENYEYWAKQVRNAVRFEDAMRSLANEGANVFVEIGPGSTLCSLGAACLADASPAQSALWIPSLTPHVDECTAVHDGLVKLHLRNVAVDWSAFYSTFDCHRVDLPTYAFHRDLLLSRRPSNWLETSSQTICNGGEKTAQNAGDMMFEINWRLIESPQIRPEGLWGLLCPSGETLWTTQAQEALEKSGIRVVSTAKIDGSERLDGWLSLWDSEGDVVQSAHRLMADALAQLQQRIQSESRLPIVWVTRHALGAGQNDQPVDTGMDQIGAAPLVGLMRTARSEHPDLHLRLIDMDSLTSLSSLGSALMVKEATELALRGDRLFEPRFERALARPCLSSLALGTNTGTVLITGGLGDLGMQVAVRLATQHGIRDFVLLSRRGMQTPGAEEAIARLLKLGAKAAVVAGNVADATSLGAVGQLFTAGWPLRGVVHAAGLVDSGTLLSLTPHKCASVFASKVDGSWNLHQLTKDMHLQFFILFSSISGVLGLPGLANYAAANAFLDSLAHLRHAQGLPATSLAYGPWAGEGMATSLVSTTLAHLSDLGLDLIKPKAGLDLLEQAVAECRTSSVPAMLDVERLRTYYTHQGGVPPLLRSLLRQSESRTAVRKVANLRDTLMGAAPEDHPRIMLDMVRATVARALGHPNSDDLDPRRPLHEFGIDSLTAVLVRNHLATLTGITLPPNIAILHPNLKSLSDYLLSSWSSQVESEKASLEAPPSVDMAAIRRGVLDPKIQFENTAATGTAACLKRPKAVFVTGATGFVGAFMVHELLSNGIKVYCLVRARTPSQAQDRVVATLKHYSLWEPQHQASLHVVVGNLSEPFLGLSEAEFDILANQVDAIFHSGALVDWMRPFDDYVGPNILGTHEVLRLASRGRAGRAVHFVSTISTLPIHSGYGLTEHDAEHGYGTSKYMAERMIVAARFRGAAASSYRLPFVAAATTDGQFRKDRGDFLHNLIAGSLDMGAFPSLDADLSCVQPVDYLCRTIAAVMLEDQLRIGRDWDFVNPAAPTFDAFFRGFARASGAVADVRFSDWHRRAAEHAAVHERSPIRRITAILDGYTDETAGGMMKGLPVGGNAFGLAAAYPAPLLGDAYVRAYLGCMKGSRA